MGEFSGSKVGHSGVALPIKMAGYEQIGRAHV
jgi:hypothetical protein